MDEDNGLTLQSLAHRLEALERENERMRSKNAELRDEVASLNGSKTSQAVEPAFEGRVSRRALLSKAGAAAVAAVAVGTLLNPREAKATHLDGAISVDAVFTHFVEAFNNDGIQPAVRAQNDGTGNGVRVLSKGGEGVNSLGVIGLLGESFTTGQAAVYGKRFDGVDPDSNGPGVVGEGLGSNYAGVLGRNPSGTGVRGEGSDQAEVAGVRGIGKTGVWGSSATTGYSGVYGEHTGSLGFGVVGDGTGAAGAGILGRNSGGEGVRGEGTNGVHGQATGGYGGLFEGGKAQLRIAPKGTAGRPTTGAHTKGELYMDSAAALFVCTASGTPGRWRKVTTTAT